MDHQRAAGGEVKVVGEPFADENLPPLPAGVRSPEISTRRLVKKPRGSAPKTTAPGSLLIDSIISSSGVALATSGFDCIWLTRERGSTEAVGSETLAWKIRELGAAEVGDPGRSVAQPLRKGEQRDYRCDAHRDPSGGEHRTRGAPAQVGDDHAQHGFTFSLPTVCAGPVSCTTSPSISVTVRSVRGPSAAS